MAHNSSRFLTIQDMKDIWRPGTSHVDKSERFNLNTVTVAFENKQAPPNLARLPPDLQGIKEPEGLKIGHAPFSASDIRQQVGSFHDYVTPTSTCANDDTRSIQSNSDTTPDRVSRTFILSRMAKTKTSWVENQKMAQDLPPRKSPILCKGRPLGNSLLTPFMENKMGTDRGTKGVRDGRKFDLLPISKYLAHYKHEKKIIKEKRLPLVRISSYHAICSCAGSVGSWDCLHGDQSDKVRQTATFFSHKDIFKPFQARSLPTRGEMLYVEPMDKMISVYEADKVKLPSLKKREDSTSTFVTQTSRRFKGQNDTRFAFPVIAS